LIILYWEIALFVLLESLPCIGFIVNFYFKYVKSHCSETHYFTFHILGATI
jgi:hypothetical protein